MHPEGLDELELELEKGTIGRLDEPDRAEPDFLILILPLVDRRDAAAASGGSAIQHGSREHPTQ